MSKLTKALTAAAGNAGGTLGYVEDVFSTYLYEGNGSTQTITNGIDLDGEGGLVWIKQRDDANPHVLFDTERGALNTLHSNQTSAAEDEANSLTSYNSDGFTLGSFAQTNGTSSNGLYASWTFRKAEKFFDVVTYTGDGNVSKQISHNLGVAPAIMIVKDLTSSNAWNMYSAARGNTKVLFLNSNASEVTSDAWWYSTTPTSTEFTVGYNASVNTSGSSYVAYLFASDAGGFGDDENIIKCGSYTGTGSAGLDIDLGFEPQWILIKNVGGGHSAIYDVMRQKYLAADLTNAETSFWSYPSPPIMPRATGITIEDTNVTVNASGNTYIYIAIRRPMKTPESGTEVFDPAQGGASVADNALVTTTNFPVDMFMNFDNYTSGGENFVVDRLRGRSAQLRTQYSAAEAFYSTNNPSLDSNEGLINRSGSTQNKSGAFYWAFKRATGFFDVVCDTRAFTYGTLNHNLKVIPELIIKKNRSRASTFWDVLPNVSPFDYRYDIYLNDTQSISGPSTAYWNSAPTDTVFGVNYGADGSLNGDDFVYYLFATLAGVSKVGSYTGTGSNVDVDCGFSAGARFILIKRTDSTGDWYVWDSERGIVAGNDPYLLLNSTAAEVTSTDYIDPLASGFTVTSSAPAALNASGGTYIFLAIA
jgi:hypothetical protein